MQLVDIPLANGILRVDKQTSAVPIAMRLGHYALPKVDGKTIEQSTQKVGDYTATIIDNGQYQLAMVPLSGWENIAVLEKTDLNPVSDESAVINVSAEFSPKAKNKIYATLMLWKKSGEAWKEEELLPVKSLESEADNVEVKMTSGELHSITFD